MAKRRLTDAKVIAGIPAARKRAAAVRKREARAKRAHYDRARGVIVVELVNGVFFGFPAQLGQGLRGASADQLAEVEVSPSGLALHWARLDADLRVTALLQGIFGTNAWMGELGRLGGRVCSPAKARAARLNGIKGGRPRQQGAPKRRLP